MRVAVISLGGPPGPRPPADGDVQLENLEPSAVALPGGLDAVVVVGGAPVAGPTASEPPRIMFPVAAFALAGGPVLGLGAGFQALCAVELLPGRLTPLAVPPGAEPSDARPIVLRVEGQPTPFTRAIAAGRLLRLPAAPVAWRYEHDAPESLEQAGQVVFRYVDDEGGVTPTADPTASARNLAGVCDPEGRVVGLAAHLVAPLATLLDAVDGVRVLDSLRDHLQGRRNRPDG